MSLGALSREAHETLAVALNRIGGKSNSGEVRGVCCHLHTVLLQFFPPPALGSFQVLSNPDTSLGTNVWPVRCFSQPDVTLSQCCVLFQ